MSSPSLAARASSSGGRNSYACWTRAGAGEEVDGAAALDGVRGAEEVGASFDALQHRAGAVFVGGGPEHGREGGDVPGLGVFGAGVGEGEDFFGEEVGVAAVQGLDDLGVDLLAFALGALVEIGGEHAPLAGHDLEVDPAGDVGALAVAMLGTGTWPKPRLGAGGEDVLGRAGKVHFAEGGDGFPDAGGFGVGGGGVAEEGVEVVAEVFVVGLHLVPALFGRASNWILRSASSSLEKGPPAGATIAPGRAGVPASGWSCGSASDAAGAASSGLAGCKGITRRMFCAEAAPESSTEQQAASANLCPAARRMAWGVVGLMGVVMVDP